MSSRGLAVVAFTMAVLAIPSIAGAGANPDFTVPLHVMEGVAFSCQDYLPVDCITYRPNVNINRNVPIAVFIFVVNHNEIQGLQTAFEWDPESNLLYGVFQCQSQQVYTAIPGNPGGPVAGQLITFFDCLADPSLAVLGYMAFAPGFTDCLWQTNPASPPGRVAAFDCDFELDEIDADDPVQQLRLGRACVGPGGHDACDPLATASKSATWGKIKAQYR